MSISQNLAQIQQQIESLSAQFQRENVRLLAPLKRQFKQGKKPLVRIMCKRAWRKLLILISKPT